MRVRAHKKNRGAGLISCSRSFLLRTMNRPRTSPAHCPGPLSRRGFLEVGAASLLGLEVGGLIESRAANITKGGTFGKAKSCVIIFLGGGPPQHETFDPKPDAPLEIRGTLRSIATKVPGV